MIENGLYKIKDEYFTDFPNENHIHNKEGRPFYYAVKDSHGIYWLIPLSSKVDIYKRKISTVENKRGVGNCITYHIGIIASEETVFRICNMLPVSENYIDGEFIIGGNHYITRDSNLVTTISRKSRNYIKQLELGRMYSQVDALAIRKKLLASNDSQND